MTTEYRLWRNGFTINNGRLRRYTDPKNEAVLKAIQKGNVRQLLEREAKLRKTMLVFDDCLSMNYLNIFDDDPVTKTFRATGTKTKESAPHSNSASRKTTAVSEGGVGNRDDLPLLPTNPEQNDKEKLLPKLDRSVGRRLPSKAKPKAILTSNQVGKQMQRQILRRRSESIPRQRRSKLLKSTTTAVKCEEKSKSLHCPNPGAISTRSNTKRCSQVQAGCVFKSETNFEFMIHQQFHDFKNYLSPFAKSIMEATGLL